MEKWKQNILQWQTSVRLYFICTVVELSVLKVHFKCWFFKKYSWLSKNNKDCQLIFKEKNQWPSNFLWHWPMYKIHLYRNPSYTYIVVHTFMGENFRFVLTVVLWKIFPFDGKLWCFFLFFLKLLVSAKLILQTTN